MLFNLIDYLKKKIDILSLIIFLKKRKNSKKKYYVF